MQQAKVIAAAAPTVGDCIVCQKHGSTMRECSLCHSKYCSPACFKKHSIGKSQQCKAICTMPPLSIPAKDYIERAELTANWSALMCRMMSLLDTCEDRQKSNKLRSDFVNSLRVIKSIPSPMHPLDIYPPRHDQPWWLAGSNCSLQVADVMANFGRIICDAVITANTSYGQSVFDHTRLTHNHQDLQLGKLIPGVLVESQPPSLDDTRLFHRLLRLWIYYMRHVDPLLVPETLRRFMKVHSDDDGELLRQLIYV